MKIEYCVFYFSSTIANMFTLSRTASCTVTTENLTKYSAEFRQRSDGYGDFTITVRSKSTKVHQAVLEERCDYFKTMFTGRFAEANTKSLDLSQVFENVDDLNCVLDYLYTGTISLSEENISSLTNAACFLLLTDLQTACSEFLTRNLSPSTCINIFALSERYSMKKLQDACLEVIKAWFPFGLCYSSEVLNLTPSCLVVMINAGVLKLLSDDMNKTFLQKWQEFWRNSTDASTPLPRDIEDLIQLTPDKKDQASGSSTQSNEEEKENVLYAVMIGGPNTSEQCATELLAFSPKTKAWKIILRHTFSKVVNPTTVPVLIGLNNEKAFYLILKKDSVDPNEFVIAVDLKSFEESVIKPREDVLLIRQGGYGEEPHYFLWSDRLHALFLDEDHNWHIFRNEHESRCSESCNGQCWRTIAELPFLYRYTACLTIPYQGALYLWAKEHSICGSALAEIYYLFLKVSEPGEDGKCEVTKLAPPSEFDYEGGDVDFLWGYSTLSNIVSDPDVGILKFTHKLDSGEDLGECEENRWQEEHSYQVLQYNVKDNGWSEGEICTIQYPEMSHALEEQTAAKYITKFPLIVPCKRLIKLKENDKDNNEDEFLNPSIEKTGLETCVGAEYFAQTISPYSTPVWKLKPGERKWEHVTYLPCSLNKFPFFQLGELSLNYFNSFPDCNFEDLSTKIGQSAVSHPCLAETEFDMTFSEKLLTAQEYDDKWRELWHQYFSQSGLTRQKDQKKE